MTPTTLYRFFDAEGGLLYAGITGRSLARWAQHATVKSWWPDVAHASVEHYPDRRAALDAERAAIKAEGPKYNIKHNRCQHPGEESHPGSMPDICRSCRDAGIEMAVYQPYKWDNGKATYECRHEHTWTCGWSVAKGRRGRDDSQMGLAHLVDTWTPTRRASSIEHPTSTSGLVKSGQVIVVKCEGRDCPPVGYVDEVHDLGLKLALYDWIRCDFGYRVETIRWVDVLELAWIPVIARDGRTRVFDMDVAADYQRKWKRVTA